MKKKKRIKVRRSWKIKPLTKVKVSDKIYKRQRAKKQIQRQIRETE